MKLEELSAQYDQSGERIRLRMVELRLRESLCTDAEERRALRRRISVLAQMRRETMELSALTRRYYERGYCRSEKYTLQGGRRRTR